MACLDNQRHERFAQEMAKGSRADEAYLAAGYECEKTTTASAAASRLLNDVNVRDRIAELQGIGAEQSATTVERLLAACWELIDKAKEDKQHNAASATLERAAKIAGLWVDKSESKVDDWRDRLAQAE